MKISVLVSTYNSPAWLQKVIWGFERQTDRNFEVLVADDGSSPANRKAVNSMLAKSGLDCQHLWQKDEGFQKCRILNKAIKKSVGDYLVFTDGDCIPSPGFVAAHRKHAEKHRFLSGGYSKLNMIISKQISEKNIRDAECFNVAWLSKQGLPASKTWLKIGASNWGLDGLLNRITPAKRTFNGNNSSCFKRDALAVNGFDERMHYGGEDREFGYRLENLGVKPKGIRYSAVCLHLDHPRGYVDPELRTMNEKIISRTRTRKLKKTGFGLV